MSVIQVGPLALPVFPLAVLLGGWLGLEISARLARRLGLNGDHIYNSVFFALAAGLVTARLAHVVFFWPAYRTQPLEIIGLNTRAFLIGPGLIAAAAAWAWYVYRRRLPGRKMLDALAPGALIALAVASIGAFIAGRNAGAPSDLPWAVTQWGVSRHPVQLYEAAAYLTFAYLAARYASPLRSSPPPPLRSFLFALLGYGLTRWLFEPFHVESATMAGGVLTAQVAGLALALAAVWLLRSQAAALPHG
jgi:phosphatidylglycerol:prolipoprotein diacylglycerol transferase